MMPGGQATALTAERGGPAAGRRDRRRLSTGSTFEDLAGYSRAVVAGDWCFVAGTTGYEYETMALPESVEGQARNALATIEATLREAGFTMSDVVRVTYYLPDRRDTDGLFSVVGTAFADIRPAASLVIAELLEPAMKIEIEVTAFRG